MLAAPDADPVAHLEPLLDLAVQDQKRPLAAGDQHRLDRTVGRKHDRPDRQRVRADRSGDDEVEVRDD